MTIAPANDSLVERITYRAPHQPPAPIPWPDGLAPSGTPYDLAANEPLPSADVLVVTWTAAEGEALADVLTPGMSSTSWKPYAHRWSSYEPQLTWRSPAREAGCLGYLAKVKIGGVDVLAVKSELHLATDGVSAPIVAQWQQMVSEARPKLVVSTGTAGGIGPATQLGDVFVVTNAKFNCVRRNSGTSPGPSGSSPDPGSRGVGTRRASTPSLPPTPGSSARWPPVRRC